MKLPFLKGFDEEALNKYLKNTGWLMFGKILGLAASLIVTRYLGPELFGDLSFVLVKNGVERYVELGIIAESLQVPEGC